MTDNDSRVSRRQMISATGVAVATSLAGCSALPGGNDGNGTDEGTPTPSGTDDFNYPNGFSENSVDLNIALGEGSVMAALDSVTTSVDRTVESPSGTQTSEQTGQFSQADDKFFVTQEATAGEQSSIQQYYYTDGTIYIRRNLPSQEKPQYTKNTLEFNVRQMYNLAQVQQHLTGISLSVDSIEQRNGQTVAVYTADETSFGSESLFTDLSESDQYGEIESASVEFVVDQQGRIHLADFSAEFATEGEGTMLLETTFGYSNFNSTTVQRPDWVDSADFRDLTTEPQIDVEFNEVEGQGVTVTVNSVQDADFVDVVIGGQPIGRVQEPGDVEVPASAYTADDGSVLKIEVYAYKEGQQPTVVDNYTPNAPASGGGTNDSTNESN